MNDYRRIYCDECDMFVTRPSYDSAVDWITDHQAGHPDHEPYIEVCGF